MSKGSGYGRALVSDLDDEVLLEANTLVMRRGRIRFWVGWGSTADLPNLRRRTSGRS